MTDSLLNKDFSPSVKVKPKYNQPLEALRGFAALGVFLVHGLGQNWLDFTVKAKGVISYLSVGGLAVYIFFMLSGYVIGLGAFKEDHFNVRSFYNKRLVRLYPAYLFAFLFLFILGTENKVWETIGNLFMLQNSLPYFNIKIPVEPHLLPIWSINYEVLYYLLFPLVFIYKPRIITITLLLAGIAMIGYHFSLIPMFITDYAIGYIFWLCGLGICWFFTTNEKVTYSFLSYMFLIISYNHFAFGSVFLKGLHLFNENTHSLGLETLWNLPLCILVISDVSGRLLPYRRIFVVISYLMPIFLIIYLLITKRLFEDTRWIACTVFYVISLMLFLERKCSKILLNSLSFIGGISYAIYIFHWPLMLIVNKYYPYSGTMPAYLQKFAIWTVLTFALAFFMEKIIQPRIREFLLKSKTVNNQQLS